MENRQIVVFTLMGHEFGIDIAKVREVLNYEEIRSVPEVPFYVEGIVNVRGVIYPIFNLCRRLNISEGNCLDEAKLILLHLEENRVGFLVDSVKEILSVQEEWVEKAPTMIKKNKVSCIDYIMKQEERIVIVLDVDALISDNENLYVEGVSDEEYCSSYTE